MKGYKAFISYSHSADDKLAPALQSALEKFAKPWYKVRNLEIFRDEGSLSASPHLWNNIVAALDQSEYMIYLASPTSEKSKWVNKEIEYWLEHKSIDTLLIALTDGDLAWDDQNNSFLNPDNNSLPPALDKKYNAEPFYVDLRDSKTQEDLSLNNPIFKKEVLKLAAHLHGMQPKDLASEEVTVHRKMIRIRNLAIGTLVLLFILAIGAGWIANEKRKEANNSAKAAIEQRNIAQANYLISEAKSAVETDPNLALRLAEEAMNKNPDKKIVEAANKIYSENSFNKIIVRDSDGITSVAYSPDGKNILTGSNHGIACLWDLKGDTIQEFKGHSNSIYSVAFSPDAKNILTGSWDNTTCLWDLKGNMIKEFPERAPINSVAFSPDGKNILIGSHKTARLWDLKGNMIQEFKGHSDEISSVAFSPDGKNILTGSNDSTARLWDLKGNTIQVFKGDSRRLSSVAFSPDSKNILTGSGDSTARLWDLKGNTIQKFKGYSDYISSVAFSPDGKKILTGSIDKTARLCDLKGNTIQEFKEYSERVKSVAFSPDGKYILTGSYDGPARLWDLKGNAIKEFKGSSDASSDVAFSRDGKKILTGSYDKTARLWDLEGNIIMEFKGHSANISAVAISPDGKKILTGSSDKIVRLWDLRGNTIRKFSGHSDEITSIAFSPDGKYIPIGSYDNTARLWNVPMDLNTFLKSGNIEPLTPEQKKEYGIK